MGSGTQGETVLYGFTAIFQFEDPSLLKKRQSYLPGKFQCGNNAYLKFRKNPFNNNINTFLSLFSHHLKFHSYFTKKEPLKPLNQFSFPWLNFSFSIPKTHV